MNPLTEFSGYKIFVIFFSCDSILELESKHFVKKYVITNYICSLNSNIYYYSVVVLGQLIV